VEAYYHPYSGSKIGLVYHLIKTKNKSLVVDYILGKGSARKNPFDTFDKITGIEKKYNAKSTFFFLKRGGGSDYNFSDTPVKNRIKKLDEEGFEIALHGSYESVNSIKNLYNEKKQLEEVLGKHVIGIRQHGLKLMIPRTFESQRFCGFKYDSSYSPPKYSKKRMYKPFYAVEGLLEIPLTFMDSDWQYMTLKNYNGSLDKTWSRIKLILDECKSREQVCTILWHPHAFYDENCDYYPMYYSHFKGFTELYERILEYGKENEAKMCTGREVFEDWRETNEIWW
jgi:peptidoglycan/xylan/chitin deacetylase (PgdA/CDA1 family)